jgi:hypothetical protein
MCERRLFIELLTASICLDRRCPRGSRGGEVGGGGEGGQDVGTRMSNRMVGILKGANLASFHG